MTKTTTTTTTKRQENKPGFWSLGMISLSSYDLSHTNLCIYTYIYVQNLEIYKAGRFL